ncbi:uncharacterized protein LOC144452601 [Glandiceps talaboti]
MENERGLSNEYLTLRAAVRGGFNHKGVFRCAMSQIVFGVLSICIGISAILVLCYPTLLIGSPIWCGLFFIATGVIGYVASAKKTDRHIKLCMVTAFLSLAIFVVIQIILCLMSLAQENLCYDNQLFNVTDPDPNAESVEDVNTRLIVDLLNLTFASVEGLVSLISFIYCCRAVYCRRNATYSPYANLSNEADEIQQDPTLPVGSYNTGDIGRNYSGLPRSDYERQNFTQDPVSDADDSVVI